MGNLFDVVKTQNKEELFAQLKNETPPRQFFGEYIHEGELSILFGDSNAGKSILANDIAFFVSGGKDWGWNFTSPNVPSLYIDMEMTDPQFAQRYISGRDCIPDIYSRASVNVYACEEEMVLNAIKGNIISAQANENPPKFIIIDNITNGFGSIHSSNKMRALIGDFKSLKDRFGLTILLIAHCPKRKANTEITADNLGGSKMIINFVDSAFAIACSELGSNERYLKQIKCRAQQKQNEVAHLQINSEPYLHLSFQSYTKEKEHLDKKIKISRIYNSITPQQELTILSVLKAHPTKSYILCCENLKNMGYTTEMFEVVAIKYSLER